MFRHSSFPESSAVTGGTAEQFFRQSHSIYDNEKQSIEHPFTAIPLAILQNGRRDFPLCGDEATRTVIPHILATP